MPIRTILPLERRTQRDPDTGRAFPLWTQSAADDIGLYDHQNAFDAQRGFVSFVPNRSGSFQIGSADRRDGRLTQVSNFEGFGDECHAPILGQMKCCVREVGIADLAKCAIPPPARWHETAGEFHVHLRLNIAPDSLFLVSSYREDRCCLASVECT